MIAAYTLDAATLAALAAESALAAQERDARLAAYYAQATVDNLRAQEEAFYVMSGQRDDLPRTLAADLALAEDALVRAQEAAEAFYQEADPLWSC